MSFFDRFLLSFNSCQVKTSDSHLYSGNTTIVSEKGDQGNAWMEGSAVINEQDAARFMFVGTRGKSFSGDIAIDDISVKTCLITPLCNDKDFMCLTTPKLVLL